MDAPPSTSSRTSHNVNLLNIPDDCLVEILRKVHPDHLKPFEMVCRRLKRLIHAYYPTLQRRRLSKLCIRLHQPMNISCDRFSLKSGIAKKRNKKLLLVEMHRIDSSKYKSIAETYNPTGQRRIIELARNILWKCVVDGTLEFQNVSITRKLLQELCRPTVDLRHVSTLNFTLCDMTDSRLQPQDFKEALSRITKPLDLYVEFCQDADKILTDEVLESIPNLYGLHAALRDTSPFTSLTDRFLDHLAQCNSLPHTLNLRDTKTQFSLFGILRLISALQRSINEQQNSAKVKWPVIRWDFGVVSTSVTELRSLEDLCESSGNSATCAMLSSFHIERCLDSVVNSNVSRFRALLKGNFPYVFDSLCDNSSLLSPCVGVYLPWLLGGSAAPETILITTSIEFTYRAYCGWDCLFLPRYLALSNASKGGPTAL
ncbi:hypothetical protein Ddc_08774 [Ditylenchus destructor]|nr:hypothetical protein Ddc_08774 [Ditylenchus destructor]